MKILKTMFASIALAALSTFALAVPAQAAQLDIDYTLTTESSMGLSPADDCSPWLGNYYYETQEIQVTQTGRYSLTNHQGAVAYSYIALYSQPFDPADPSAGCLAASSGSALNKATLDVDTKYWIYLSTVYSDNVGNFKGTISGPGNIVLGAPTTTSLSVTPSSTKVGDAVTLVVTVSGTNATGTVDFFNGTELIDTATVSAGEAILTYSPSTAGSQDLTARYNGDNANRMSVSEVTILTVEAAPNPTPNPNPNPNPTPTPAPAPAPQPTPTPTPTPKPIQAPTPPVSVDTGAR